MSAADAVKRACEIVGGQAALASLVGVQHTMVWQWVDGRKLVSPKRSVLIEEATGGEVTCEQLCPDVKWGVLRRTALKEALKK